jgi:hypothetical protein
LRSTTRARRTRQALTKLQAKYAQRSNAGQQQQAGPEQQAAADASAALRAELESVRARLADALATQGELQRSVDEARRDAARRVPPPARTPATSAPAIDGPSRDELVKENEELRRKLAKKFPSATTSHAGGSPASTPAQAMASSSSSSPRPPGVVVVHDEGGREVRQRIVLLRGHEKSGTTWLRQLMSLHPRINMAPKEFQFNFVQSAVERFTKEPWMGATPSLSRLAHFWCDEFVHAMLGAVAAKQPDKLWIGEKSPKAIEPVMPGAHYIYIVRDGRDVLVSLFWHHVRIGGFKTWCDGGVPVAPWPTRTRGSATTPTLTSCRTGCWRWRSACASRRASGSRWSRPTSR